MPARSGESLDPDPREVRAELDRILVSRPFHTSPKLTSFLRFVVESTLAGRGERLKGYTIGVEALGRGESFNPQIDPIVRVEAVRLRAALGRYYSGAGAHDPVIIEMPRGRYVVRFRRRMQPGGAQGLVMSWRQIVRTLHRFLGLRLTIQVHAPRIARDGFGAGKLAAPQARLLPPAAIAQAPTSDGRQEQQAEGPSAARSRRPGTGRDRRHAAHD